MKIQNEMGINKSESMNQIVTLSKLSNNDQNIELVWDLCVLFGNLFFFFVQSFLNDY